MSALAPFTTRIRTNVDNVLQMTQMIDGIMMTGDSRANQIIVQLYGNNGNIQIASGTKIVGYFIRGDGYTVEVDGEVTENGEAKVIIPRSAYLVTGALSIAIRLLDDRREEIIDGEVVVTYDTKIVIAALSCFVQNTETDAIIDPDHHIPDVQELLAFIDLLDRQYTAVATAEAGRVIAENAREAENARITQAIDYMSVSAEQVTYDGSPYAHISDISGHKHITFGIVAGKPFRIKRTFQSVAEMMAYTGSDIEPGDMVIIVTNVEDPDNGALYIRTDDDSWSFIVDMSGATGIQGPQGERGLQGETGPRGLSISRITFNQDGTANIILENETSFQTPPIKGEQGIQGERGIQGETGPRGLSIDRITFNQDGTANIILEDGSSFQTPPIKGDKGDPGVNALTFAYQSASDEIEVLVTTT